MMKDMISVEIFSEKGQLTRQLVSTETNQSESSEPKKLNSQRRSTEPQPSPQSTPIAIRPRGSTHRCRSRRTGKSMINHTVTDDPVLYSCGSEQDTSDEVAATPSPIQITHDGNHNHNHRDTKDNQCPMETVSEISLSISSNLTQQAPCIPVTMENVSDQQKSNVSRSKTNCNFSRPKTTQIPSQSLKRKQKKSRKSTSSHNTSSASITSTTSTTTSSLEWRQKAKEINRVLWNHPKSVPFRKPVDPVKDEAPDYNERISNPMDLNTLGKSLIGDDSVAPTENPREYIKKLMLIWDNAQDYNIAAHWIHEHAISLRAHSVKLIKLHFPQMDLQPYIPSRGAKQILSAIFDPSKGLLCAVCRERLSFEVGYHEHCEGLKHRLSLRKCAECHRKLDNPRTPFYHCVSGCTQRRGDRAHSIFLCTSCAEEKYHTKQLMIGNQSDSSNIAFRGLFLDLEALENRDKLWFEAIVIQQNVPRVSYELVLSTENESSQVTNAIIVDEGQRRIKVMEEQESSTDWQDATLSVDGRKLTFYDSECPENTTTFEKIVPECVHCGTDMLFMERDHLPADFHKIYCDTHDQYYETQRKLSAENRCLCFKEMNPKHTKQIYKERFYFSCNECRFEMCRMCVLIKCEMEFKKEKCGDDRNLATCDSGDAINARGSEERDTMASVGVHRTVNRDGMMVDSMNEVQEQSEMDAENSESEAKQEDQNQSKAAITLRAVTAVPGSRCGDARKRINSSIDLLDQLRKAATNQPVLSESPESTHSIPTIGHSTSNTNNSVSARPIRLSAKLSGSTLCSKGLNVKSETNQNHDRQSNEPPRKKQRISLLQSKDIHCNEDDDVNSNDPTESQLSHHNSVANTSRKRKRNEITSELNQDMDTLSNHSRDTVMGFDDDDRYDKLQQKWEAQNLQIATLKKKLAANQVDMECQREEAQQRLENMERKYNRKLRKQQDDFNEERGTWKQERENYKKEMKSALLEMDQYKQRAIQFEKKADAMKIEHDSVQDKLNEAVRKIHKVANERDQYKKRYEKIRDITSWNPQRS